MPKYLINNMETWEVEADSEEEAIDKFGQARQMHGQGLLVNNEVIRFIDQDILIADVRNDDGE